MANLNIPSTRDRTLDAFKGKMVGGGARPNLFAPSKVHKLGDPLE